MRRTSRDRPSQREGKSSQNRDDAREGGDPSLFANKLLKLQTPLLDIGSPSGTRNASVAIAKPTLSPVATACGPSWRSHHVSGMPQSSRSGLLPGVVVGDLRSELGANAIHLTTLG